MSDTSDIRITTSVDTTAAAAASAALSQAMLQLTGQINSFSVAAIKASNVYGSLDRITKGVSNSTKTLTGFVQAYSTAQNVTNNIVANANLNLKVLDATMTRIGSSSPRMTAALKAQATQFSAITANATALNRALTMTGIQQFANQSKSALTMSTQSLLRTTTQTLAFTRALRTAFFSLADLEVQSVRVTKLLADNFGSGAEGISLAKKQVELLGTQLDAITRKYGASRVLVQSIAGDFAELGISGNDALSGLAELTVMVEKLGNVDITQSQKFVESMLQNILRVKREQAADKGLSVDLTDPKQFNIILEELRGQLAEFNYIENKTTLSLKDIADAFPEVSAAATTFGLSMTETAAFLAPMVAAGFQVGASANSIKVSLQRMVAQTKQNTGILGELNKALGPEFNYAAGVSMKNIQALTDGFNTLRESYGDQGTLELFARLFGVRQGPRMETSIRQAAIFSRNLVSAGTVEQRISSQLEESINKRLKEYKMEEISVKKIVDISNLHRSASEKVNGVYTERAEIMRMGQQDAFVELNKQFEGIGQSGADFISKIGTDFGKVMMSTGFRIEDTSQEQLTLELELALDTTITRFRILKEEVLAIGRAFVTAFDPLIKIMIKIIQPIRDFIQRLTPGMKKLLSFVVIFLALLPTVKLLAMSFKFFYASSIGGIARMILGFGNLGSKIISVTELIDRGDKALKGFAKAVQISPDKILLTGKNKGGFADTSGLSPSLREARASGATPSLKSLIKMATGSKLVDPGLAMTGLLDSAGDAASSSMAAAVGSAARAGIAEALIAGFKNTTFVTNKFLGNNFGGRGPGTGTPRGPRSIPPEPTVSGEGVRRSGTPRPVHGPERPYGPFLPSEPVYGPSLPPEPVYGPERPKAPTVPSAPSSVRPRVPTVPAIPSVPVSVDGRGVLPAPGGMRPGASLIPPPLPTIPSITEPAKVATKTVVASAAAVTAAATDASTAAVEAVSSTKDATTGAVKSVKSAAAKAGKGAKAASASVKAAVVATTSVAAEATAVVASSVAAVGGAVSDTTAPAADIIREAGAAAKKSVKQGAAAIKTVTLSTNEIRDTVRNAGKTLIGTEFEFIDTLNREYQVTSATKKKVLQDIQDFAKSNDMDGPAGPLGKVNPKKRNIQPSGTGRALQAATVGRGKTGAGQSMVISDLLQERLERAKLARVPPHKTKSIQDVFENLKEGMFRASKEEGLIKETGASKTARETARRAKENVFNKREGELLKNQFKGLTLTAKDTEGGLEEVFKATKESVDPGLSKALIEEQEAIKAFENMDARTTAQEQKSVQKRMRDAKRKVRAYKDLGAVANPYRATTVSEVVPASQLSQEVQRMKQLDPKLGGTPGVFEGRRTPGKEIRRNLEKDINNAVTGFARASTDEVKMADAAKKGQGQIKAALAALTMEKEEAIKQAIDNNDARVLDSLKKMSYDTKTSHDSKKVKTPKSKQASAFNRQVIRRLAEQQIAADEALSRFDIESPSHDPDAGKKLFTKENAKKLAARKRQQAADAVLTSPVTLKKDDIESAAKVASKEASELEKTINKMGADHSKESQSARKKLANSFNKSRAALIKRYGSIEAVEAALASQAAVPVAPAGRAASAASAAPSAASVVKPVTVAASGAGAVRLPSGVQKVFFSDAIKAASAGVVGAARTIGDEVASLLDQVLLKAIPAGMDPAKAKVIRAVVAKVLAETPITAASAATPAAQKFMTHVLGGMGDDVARVIDSLAPDITKALSAGGLSSKGGIVQNFKSDFVGKFNKLKNLATAKIVGDLAMLRTGISAAVFDSIAAAGYAVESTTSSVAAAIAAGTYTDDMLPSYLDDLTTKRRGRSAAAAEHGRSGAEAASESRPVGPSKEERNAARRKTRAVDRLVKEGKAPDVAAAASMYDDAVAKGADEVDKLLPKTKGVAKVKESITAAIDDAKEAVSEIIEAPAAALGEASEEVGKVIDGAKEKIVDASEGLVEAAGGATPASVRKGPGPFRTPEEIVRSRASLSSRTGDIREIKGVLGAAGGESNINLGKAIAGMRASEEGLIKDLAKLEASKAAFSKNIMEASTPKSKVFWEKELEKINKEIAKKAKNLKSVGEKLNKADARITRALADVHKKMSATPSAATAGSAAAGSSAAPAAGAAAGAASRVVPGVAAPAAGGVAVATTSAIVEKLDDVIVEFDRSLANFFKGPNFFQGPNYFAGPLQLMPNAKFSEIKKPKFSELPTAAKAAKLSKLETLAARGRARIAARGAGAPALPVYGPEIPAPLKGLGKITDPIKRGISRAVFSGLKVGASLGGKAISGVFNAVGKGTGEFFKMAGAFANIYTTSLLGVGKASKVAAVATRASSAASVFSKSASIIATKAIMGTAAASLALGRALGATTKGELATFIASLQKSKILKLWYFLLFTGMKPVMKAFTALTAAGFRFLTTMKFGSLIAGFQALYASILKTSLSLVGLAIKLNAALLLVAPLIILVFSIFSKLKRGFSSMSPSMENFRAAWVAIKDAIYILAKPLENLILRFTGFNDEASSTGRTAGVIYAISLAVRKAAEAFQNFSKGGGLKYMNQVVVPVITRLINRFKLLGGAIKNSLGGDGAKASKDFKAFLASLLYEVAVIATKIVDVIATLIEMAAPSLARLIDHIVAATVNAFRAIMSFANETLLIVGSIVAAIGALTANPALMLAGGAMAASGVAFLYLDQRMKKFADRAKNVGLDASKNITNGIAGGVRAAANGMEKIKRTISAKYFDITGKSINAALVSGLKDLPDDVKQTLVKSADDANAGGRSLGQEIAKGIKQGLQSLKEEFTDKLFGKADEEVDKFVDKIKEALDKQKDKALEAFDNQVEAIEALADAEEKLTAKIEYEEKRREMIRERALDKDNYMRERKVAAYEGRTEDVRSLDLTFRKSDKDSSKAVDELDLDRVKSLQAENRSTAIKVIQKEKEKLTAEYEKMFKDFDEKVEMIKLRGFSNVEEFKGMFTNIQNAASGFSDVLASAFQKSMLALPSAIREHTDPSIGMFNTSMDKLVASAKTSFGVGVTAANSESILGAAYHLVKGMPAAFRDSFDSGIISTFVTPFVTTVKGQLLTIVPEDLFTKSAALAMVELVAEMKRKLEALKGGLYDGMKELFGKMTEEDWNSIFGIGSAFSDLASLKAYFDSLFPKAEELRAKIVTIETARSAADGGGDEKKTTTPGLTPSEIEPLRPPSIGKPADRYPGAMDIGRIDTETGNDGLEKKKNIFEKIRDIIGGIAGALGPVQTAILGVIGIFAGFKIAGIIFGLMKVAIATMVGAIAPIPLAIATIIGLLIYAYARFESVRDIVNGIAIAIYDGLVSAFNYVKDLTISFGDSIFNLGKNIFDFGKKIYDAIFPTMIKIYEIIVDTFAIAGVAVAKSLFAIGRFVVKVLGSIIGGTIGVVVDFVKMLGSIFGPPLDLIMKLIGITIAGIVIAFGFLLKIFIDIWHKFRDPVAKFVGFFFDVMTDAFNIATDVFTAIIDAIFNIFSDGFKIISKIFDFLYDSIGKGFMAVVGVVVSIVKKVIDVFKAGAPTIGDVFTTIVGIIKTVFEAVSNIVGPVLGFIISVFQSAFGVIKDVIGGASKFFTPIIDVLQRVGAFVLTLLIAPFKFVFEILKKIAQNPIVVFFARLLAMIGLIAAMLATWGIKFIVEGAVFLIQKLFGAMKSLAGVIIDGVGAALGFIKDIAITVFNAIYGAVKGFIDWWRTNVGSLWLLLVAGFVIVYELVKIVFGFIFDIVKDKIIPVIATLAGFVKDVLVGAFNIVKDVVGVFFNIAKTVFGAVGSVIKVVAGFVKDLLVGAFEVVVTVVNFFWEAIKTGWSFIGPILNTIVDIVGKVLVGAWGVLKGAVKFFWDTITGGWANVGPTFDTIVDVVGNVLVGAWGVLKGAVSFFWDVITGGWGFVGPILNTIVDVVGNILVNAWNTLKSAASFFWDVITAGWSFVGPIFDTIIDIIGNVLVGAWGILKGAAGFFWDVITAGWSFVGPIFDTIIDIVGNILVGAWDVLKGAVSFFWDVITAGWSVVGPIFDTIFDFIGNLLVGAWDTLKGAANFFWDAITAGWGFVGPIFDTIFDFLQVRLTNAWNNIKAAANFFWDAIKSGWGFVGPILKQLYDALKDGIEFAINLVIAAWDKFVSVLKSTKDFIIDIIQKIGGFIRDGIQVVIEKVISVWNGLKTAFQNVWDTIKPIISFIGDAIKQTIGGAIDLVVAGIKLIPTTFKTIVNGVSSLFNRLVDGLGDFGFPKTILGIPLPFGLGGKKVSDFITLPKLPTLYNGGQVGSYMKGGMMYGAGGMTYGPAQQGIPAILHGGEYVVNHKAVKRIGTDTLDALNNLRLSKPANPVMPSIPGITMPGVRIDNSTSGQMPSGSSTQNVNIYVDTFVGEPEWFNSMMKDYNMKVLPRNQKTAGLENRVIRTYNGINKGA